MMSKKNEKGNALILTLACFLPILFFLASITLDVTAYLKRLRDVTQLLDDAGLYAQRFLPNQEQARHAIKNYLQLYAKQEASCITYQVSTSDISLRYENKIPIFFAEMLNHQVTLPLVATSKVQCNFLDVLILLDVGKNLKPYENAWEVDLKSEDESPWNAANYFRELDVINPLLATQNCFNPAINPRKNLAILMWYFYNQINLNAVGITVYPANILEKTLTLANVKQNQNLQLSWPANLEQTCFKASSIESDHSKYAFPFKEVKINRNNQSERYTVPEIVWGYPVQNEHGEFMLALEQIKTQLLNSLPIPARGGLINNTPKTAIIIASELPWINENSYPENQLELEKALVNLKFSTFKLKKHIKIYYLFWPHLGQEMYSLDLLSDFKDKVAVYNEKTRDASFNFQFLFAEDFSAMRKIVDGVLLDKRGGLIKR